MKKSFEEWVNSSLESLGSILDSEDVVFDAGSTTLGSKAEDAYILIQRANSLMADIKASM